MRDIRNIRATGEKDRIAEGLDLAAYLALPHMSGSSLNQPSPKNPTVKHMRAHYETDTEVTDAMRVGAATDALLFDYLVPARRDGRSLKDAVDEFDSDWPVFGQTRRGKAWESFHDEQGENYLRTFDERQEIVAMLNAVIADQCAAPYWTEGVAQATTLCTEDGLLFKGRPDWVCDSIVDLKTTARIDRCSGTTFSLGYHIKAALYRRWWKRLTGFEKPCVLIFVESQRPFDVAVVHVDIATLMLAEEKALDRIRSLREAMDKDVWPGVANGQEMPLEVPWWEMEDGQDQGPA